MERRAIVSPWVGPGREGAHRNARRSLDERARAQAEVTAAVERVPPPAAPSPGPAAAPPPLTASAASGH